MQQDEISLQAFNHGRQWYLIENKLRNRNKNIPSHPLCLVIAQTNLNRLTCLNAHFLQMSENKSCRLVFGLLQISNEDLENIHPNRFQFILKIVYLPQKLVSLVYFYLFPDLITWEVTQDLMLQIYQWLISDVKGRIPTVMWMQI